MKTRTLKNYSHALALFVLLANDGLANAAEKLIGLQSAPSVAMALRVCRRGTAIFQIRSRLSTVTSLRPESSPRP